MAITFTGNSSMKFVTIGVCLLFIIFVIWKLYRDNIAYTGEDAIYWPPEIDKCPDYWEFKNGKCHRGGQTIEPLSGDVTAEQLITRCEQVKAMNVPWEGIDNLC